MARRTEREAPADAGSRAVAGEWPTYLGASESAAAVLAEHLDERSARQVLDLMYHHGFDIVISYAHGETADPPETDHAVPQLTRLLTESLAATRGLAEISERLQVGPSSLLTELANLA